ncbi:cell wall-binding repeat-containing protein [Marisediminicola senii]|uniref:cell wall-binding repeat-containing protein n=1 Tax=Marisediminicola senii TaxID=2711233 RepID=UPI0013EB3487|nr:cell wall-binding repeat-containing protein [Marisediminicola senii]
MGLQSSVAEATPGVTPEPTAIPEPSAAPDARVDATAPAPAPEAVTAPEGPAPVEPAAPAPATAPDPAAPDAVDPEPTATAPAADDSSASTGLALSSAAASTQRFGGADRFAVAVGVSATYSPGVPVLYIVKGTDYPDALSAAPAAIAGGGPLLLTLPTSIPDGIRNEIRRLRPAKIVVVGGSSSVSDSVYNELAGMTPSIVRLGGADRYEASRAVVDYAFGRTGANRIYLATGANFPDALSASSAAGNMSGGVLLVPGANGSLDQPTLGLIDKVSPSDVVIAGGPASVSTGIESQLKGMSFPRGSMRLGGADRFEASRNINKEAFRSASSVFIATGHNFPDALTGAVLAGKTRAPLYVSRDSCVPRDIASDISAFAPARVNILGGLSSMSSAIDSLTPCAVVSSWYQPFDKYFPITSNYGWRIHPITGVRTMHNGTDWSGSGITGYPIRSISDGTVTRVNNSYSTSGEGNSITIMHSGNTDSRSMHMRAPTTLRVGDRVSAGQVIGYVGTTGGSTGAHLHLEVRVNGGYVDPLAFLKGYPYAP